MLLKLADDSVYLSKSIKQILFGDLNDKKIDVKLYTDSRSTLESVASTKQVERKMMRNIVAALKEFLIQNDVTSYSWLGDEMMAADILTKEKKENKSMSEILVHGIFNPRNNDNNLVFYDGNEVRIENIIGKH